jgi:hypothetical protein
LIITNHPSLDDMYEKPEGLWRFGTWVNGGHWSTCEARMMMAYYRLGKQDDARKSMKRMLDYARRFRMDNPLVDFGGNVYQPNEPINCVYDNWGVPAALIRGLFEYRYQADQLVLLPHIPPGITELQQRFPIRFGQKRLLLSTAGRGPITGVTVNGEPWRIFDAESITLPYDKVPSVAQMQVLLGGAAEKPVRPFRPDTTVPPPATIDWKAVAAESFPLISSNDLPLRIGADSDGQSRFVGQIGPCRVFSRAIKPEEVAALAQGTTATLDKDPALVACWKFDQQKAGQMANALGDFLPAKIVGEVKVVDGPKGKAVSLEGRGYLEVANDPRLKLTKGCTLEAWIRPGKLASGGGRILDKCRVGTANGYMIDTFPGGSLRLIVEWGSPSCDAKLPPEQWSHVAGTVDADGVMALYVNGKQFVQTKPLTAPPEIASLDARVARVRRFYSQLAAAGKEETYEAAHARLVIRYLATCQKRLQMLAEGKLGRLPPPSQYAADRSYFTTTVRLCEGLEKVLDSYAKTSDAEKKPIYQLWIGTKE